MKAGTLPVDESQNALAAADPQGMAENYQQVKSRTQAALHTIVENAEPMATKISSPFRPAPRCKL
jgi:probable phosphoglycerate mutase